MSSVFDEFSVDKYALHIKERTVYIKKNFKTRCARMLIGVFVQQELSHIVGNVVSVVAPRKLTDSHVQHL